MATVCIVNHGRLGCYASSAHYLVFGNDMLQDYSTVVGGLGGVRRCSMWMFPKIVVSPSHAF